MVMDDDVGIDTAGALRAARCACVSCLFGFRQCLHRQRGADGQAEGKRGGGKVVGGSGERILSSPSQAIVGGLRVVRAPPAPPRPLSLANDAADPSPPLFCAQGSTAALSCASNSTCGCCSRPSTRRARSRTASRDCSRGLRSGSALAARRLRAALAESPSAVLCVLGPAAGGGVKAKLGGATEGGGEEERKWVCPLLLRLRSSARLLRRILASAFPRWPCRSAPVALALTAGPPSHRPSHRHRPLPSTVGSPTSSR